MNSQAEAPGQPKSGPKRPLPDFLAGRVGPEQHEKWPSPPAPGLPRSDSVSALLPCRC